MRKHSSKNLDLKSLLKNRNVLYVVLFLAVANLFGYLMMKQLDAVAFFIIIGFLTTYFSKNMIVVMLTSIISTFLLVQIKLLGRVQEGMTGASDETTDASGNKIVNADASAENDATKGDETDAESSAEKATSAPPDAIATSEIPISKELREKITASKGPTEGMKSREGAKKEKFTQQLSPARFNSSDDDDVPRHKPKIDYAATLESAYDNLDKLLSSDSIRNMSEDTGRLAEKQKLLMGNIEKLTPIMEKAGKVLEGLDVGSIMGGLQDKLKGFEKLAPAGMKK